jgi:hypothetical protein
VSGVDRREGREIRSDPSAKANALQIIIQPKIIRHNLSPNDRRSPNWLNRHFQDDGRFEKMP